LEGISLGTDWPLIIKNNYLNTLDTLENHKYHNFKYHNLNKFNYYYLKKFLRDIFVHKKLQIKNNLFGKINSFKKKNTHYILKDITFFYLKIIKKIVIV
jgi:hypothetical protein